MTNNDAELDRLQGNYKAAVDSWIAAIRAEERPASVPHSVAQIDTWDNAHFAAEEARRQAEAAKKAY
jgi:hypothetical protein